MSLYAIGDVHGCAQMLERSAVDAVVILCNEEHCPVIHSDALRESWPLPDPVMIGQDALDGFRVIRDELHLRISSLFREH